MYAIIFHAHQKLDRVARRHFSRITPDDTLFPSISQIIHFEGRRGPDGAKLKRQTQGGEQPWHFVDPHNPKDTELYAQIRQHYAGLVEDLRRKDTTRAAYEAAWLAHALVDGLTPAHHYPYEQELARLRGEARDTRKGLIGRLYIKGDTLLQSMERSLKLVGPKGLLTTHALFEAGAYTIIAPLRLRNGLPTSEELTNVTKKGVIAVFQELAQEVTTYNLYGRFYATGWTRALSRDVRRELAPRMVRMITLAWYAAYVEANEVKL